jgi:hypothetical protein
MAINYEIGGKGEKGKRGKGKRVVAELLVANPFPLFPSSPLPLFPQFIGLLL